MAALVTVNTQQMTMQPAASRLLLDCSRERLQRTQCYQRAGTSRGQRKDKPWSQTDLGSNPSSAVYICATSGDPNTSLNLTFLTHKTKDDTFSL